MSLLPIHKEPKLEKLSIAGTTFLVDHQRQELRQENNKNNRITFDKLKAHRGEEGINIVFDRITSNLYTGYLSGQGLPPMTERVFLNSSLLDNQSSVNQQQTASDLKADNAKQWQGEWNKPQQKQQSVKKRKSLSRRLS